MKIALCGHAYSGKSSIAQVLRNKYGFTILSFAEPIKQSNLIFDKLNLPKEPKASRRKVYQALGSWARNSLGKDIFIKKLEPKLGLYDKIVIDDLRFKNEYRFLKENGFFIVKVETPWIILCERAGKEGENPVELFSDESELEIDLIKEFDLIVSGIVNPELSADLIISKLEEK